MGNYKENGSPCICEKLKKVGIGTNLRILLKESGEVTLTLLHANGHKIVGKTISNVITNIVCHKIAGFFIVPNNIPSSQPTGETIIEPGQSVPLSDEPILVSAITFDARTPPGTTSELTAFVNTGQDFDISSIEDVWIQVINEHLQHLFCALEDLLGYPPPLTAVGIVNTGSSPVFISNLQILVS